MLKSAIGPLFYLIFPLLSTIFTNRMPSISKEQREETAPIPDTPQKEIILPPLCSIYRERKKPLSTTIDKGFGFKQQMLKSYSGTLLYLNFPLLSTIFTNRHDKRMNVSSLFYHRRSLF